MLDVKVLFGANAALVHQPLAKSERVLLTAPVRSTTDRQRRCRLLLKMMAIDAWRLKHVPCVPESQPEPEPQPVITEPVVIESAAVGPAGYIYELYHNNQRVGLVLATAAQETSAVQALILKMIAAIRCSVHRGGWYAKPPRGIPLAGRSAPVSPSKWRFIITLGEGWCLDPAVAVVINSYSPQQLLDQPALKASAWRALKEVFPLIS